MMIIMIIMENFRIVLDCRQEKNMNNFHDSFTFYSMHLLTGWDCLWAGVVESYSCLRGVVERFLGCVCYELAFESCGWLPYSG